MDRHGGGCRCRASRLTPRFPLQRPRFPGSEIELRDASPELEERQEEHLKKHFRRYNCFGSET